MATSPASAVAIVCVLLTCHTGVFGQTIRHGQVSKEASGQLVSINCGSEQIQILSAHYGINCNSDLRNNELSNLEVACNGLTACNYLVDHTVIGDPAPNCAKTYEYLYRCVDNVYSGVLTAEAHSKTLTIDCDPYIIQIVSASYGRNCRSDLRNQQTRELAIACQDRLQCSYTVDYRVIGDPAPNCAKTYEYSYQCQKYDEIGCFADTWDRALRYGPGPGASHSIDSCAVVCSQYAYFAIEYGSECFCDNDPVHATKHGPSGGCDNTFVTGGAWSFNLFANLYHLQPTRRGFEEQVVDGVAVTWSAKPFNVYVADANGRCSGSIMSLSNMHGRGVILTAAHCNMKSGTVKIGVSDGTQSGDEYTISKWLPHPDYEKDDGGWNVHRYWQTYDAALIFLDRAITTSGATAISIAIGANWRQEPVTVYGYGYSTSGWLSGNSGSSLRSATNKVEDCYYFVSDHKSQFCTRSEDGKSCQGDSGGPVLGFTGKQVGINSYGETFASYCYQNGLLEYFKDTKTDITGSEMTQWIQGNIDAY